MLHRTWSLRDAIVPASAFHLVRIMIWILNSYVREKAKVSTLPKVVVFSKLGNVEIGGAGLIWVSESRLHSRRLDIHAQ